MDILTAIKSRASTRAFLDKPVPKKIVTDVLEAARWAASGANTQPWKVSVVMGGTKQAISEKIIEARESGVPENPDYQYYPLNWLDPYKTRRKDCGYALYSALGVAKDDTEKRKEVWYKNYYFFHAPVGMLFFVDKNMEKGSWVDMGMFIQNVMLAALAFDLATCPQASLSEYPDIIRDCLKLSEENLLVCGLSLGYPDKTAPVNNYKLERAAVDEFTKWYD